MLDALEDPNGDNNTSDSILDNTMIVFTADNGAETHFSFSTSPGYKNGLPLRGDKTTVYEGGHAIPFMVKWDGEVPAGTVSSQMVELNDFMATVADVVDYQLPAGAAEDSFNLAPLLRGESTGPVRNAGVQISFSGAKIIRQVDSAGNEWKLAFTPTDGGFSGTAINPALPITNFSQLQLFNLTADPSETTNLLAGGGTEAMLREGTLAADTFAAVDERRAHCADHAHWRLQRRSCRRRQRLPGLEGGLWERSRKCRRQQQWCRRYGRLCHLAKELPRPNSGRRLTRWRKRAGTGRLDLGRGGAFLRRGPISAWPSSCYSPSVGCSRSRR